MRVIVCSVGGYIAVTQVNLKLTSAMNTSIQFIHNTASRVARSALFSMDLDSF